MCPKSESNATELLIRSATDADLPRLWQIRATTEASDPLNPPPAGPTPLTLSHVLRTATVLLAEHQGRVVGFGGRADRSGVSFLTDLFVDPAAQSTAIGGTLLRALFNGVDHRRFTLASTDPRAVALYTRLGMTPRWPNLDLVGDENRLRLPAVDRVTLTPADPLDPAFLEWDYSVGRRRRPEDFAFFRDEQAASCFWIETGEGRAGYAVVRRDGAPGGTETLAIGPVGAQTSAMAKAGSLAAVAWASSRAARLKISVPGPHPALRSLLEAGFRIDYIGTFCAAPSVRINPARYIASGEDLF